MAKHIQCTQQIVTVVEFVEVEFQVLDPTVEERSLLAKTVVVPYLNCISITRVAVSPMVT